MNQEYWVKELKNVSLFTEVYEDIKNEKNYENLKIDFTDDLLSFLDDNKYTVLEFITAILTIYLSRTNNTKGSIFNYKNKTFYKLNYDKNKSILKHLTDTKKDIDKFNNHASDDLRNKIEILYPEIVDSIYAYSITDFDDETDYNSIINFKINQNFVDIHYDINFFADDEIKSFYNNIKTLIANSIKNHDVQCGHHDFL